MKKETFFGDFNISLRVINFVILIYTSIEYYINGSNIYLLLIMVTGIIFIINIISYLISKNLNNVNIEYVQDNKYDEFALKLLKFLKKHGPHTISEIKEKNAEIFGTHLKNGKYIKYKPIEILWGIYYLLETGLIVSSGGGSDDKGLLNKAKHTITKKGIKLLDATVNISDEETIRFINEIRKTQLA